MILGIDTSFSETSVAVIGDENSILYTFRKPPKPSHSTSLLSIIESGLDEMDRSIFSFDAIAVTRGPGSFTGIRTGLSTAMGLADASGVALVGVDTLDAIMEATSKDSDGKGVWPWLCAVVHARKNEVYAALFQQVDGVYKRQRDDFACEPLELANMIAGPTLFVGDGFLPYSEMITKRVAFPIDHLSAPARPVAYGAAILAAEGIKNKEADQRRPTPKYVRQPQAVINWEKLHTSQKEMM